VAVRRFTLALTFLILTGCESLRPPPENLFARLASFPPVAVWLLGELHDHPDHQRIERDTVQWLATQGRLAALVLEMAEQGRSTAGLPATAPEAQVRAALGWGPGQNEGWPWAQYGPVVMAAVRAGRPVLGANLPRARLREAAQDQSLDARLDAAALQLQSDAIREGHCHALPEHQITPMVRMQIARDLAMAQVTAEAVSQATRPEAGLPGPTVLLVSGRGHADRRLGVPRHLVPLLQVKNLQIFVIFSVTDSEYSAIENIALADTILRSRPAEARDHCAAFKPRG
jgi:uncharacterized iron-regulated protein